LSTYKYTGGEHAFPTSEGHANYILFSGPVQLNDLDTQNTITFSITKNDTVVRLYAEHAEITFTLKDVTSAHAKAISGGISGSSVAKKLSVGTYKAQLGHATAHSRANAAALPPRTQLTIMVADPAASSYYN
jgi:hypothetical protein